MTTFAGTVGLTLTFLGFLCILLWAVKPEAFRSPLVKSLAWIGRYSYSIYLGTFLPHSSYLPRLEKPQSS